MYYSPPKSSVWGHSLRKMKPDIQRDRVNAFLSSCTAGHAFATGALFFQPASFPPPDLSDFEEHFKKLLGLGDPQPGFSNLTEEQFELCFQELLRRPSLYEPGRQGATVTALYTISAWKVGGRPINTSSSLGVYYGGRPWIVPRFHFETDEIFEYLRTSLENVGLCKMNPKHIKGRKQ